MSVAGMWGVVSGRVWQWLRGLLDLVVVQSTGEVWAGSQITVDSFEVFILRAVFNLSCNKSDVLNLRHLPNVYCCWFMIVRDWDNYQIIWYLSIYLSILFCLFIYIYKYIRWWCMIVRDGDSYQIYIYTHICWCMIGRDWYMTVPNVHLLVIIRDWWVDA